MAERIFSRTELIIGAEGAAKLKASSVAVFGIGGVGSYTAEALARGGVGKLTFIDNDKVCPTNINRQLIALTSTVGRNKAEVMRDRALDINHDAEVTARVLFYGSETVEQFDLANYDYIVDAIDTVTAKLLLIENAVKAGVRIISSMGAGNKLDPAAFKVADIYSTKVCPLARVMRNELKKRGIKALKVVYSEEMPLSPMGSAGCETNRVCPPGSTGNCMMKRQIPGSISFVPSVAGLILAGEVIKDLISG